MKIPTRFFANHSRSTDLIALTIMLFILAPFSATAKEKSDSDLSDWNDSPRKKAIVDFVKAVTDEKSPDFVKPSERIAVFDNDGTLWCEQPLYPQVVFIKESAKAYAKEHPEILENDLFEAVVNDDTAVLSKAGAKGTQELVGTTYKGLTIEEFSDVVSKWFAREKHPRFHQPYTRCVYQPMLEIITYLQKHSFKTYIVSGGGTDFMRPWTEEVYAIPPEHVIGSTTKTQFSDSGNKPTIRRLPEIDFICDSLQKPVAIARVIGRRPIAAFGNSNGDLAMLQWTVAGSGKRLAALVHHTDAEREYAYDRDSKVGRLDKALDVANQKGWVVIDMKNDWKKVFPFE